MSIKPINPHDQDFKLRNRLLTAGGMGAVAGGLYTAKDKNWLYKGTPSDTFVKTVSDNMKKGMTSDELMESSKIYRFVEKAVNPSTDIEELKPLILDSKELSDAIKQHPEESVDNAISRVFSQPNKDKVRQDLLELQFKTSSNKKTGKNAAMKLVHENFDASTKRFTKSKGTSAEAFNMIKSSAKKIQLRSVAIGAAVVGAAAGAIALIASDVPDAK